MKTKFKTKRKEKNVESGQHRQLILIPTFSMNYDISATQSIQVYSLGLKKALPMLSAQGDAVQQTAVHWRRYGVHEVATVQDRNTQTRRSDAIWRQ